MKFLFALSFLLFACTGFSQNLENESKIIEFLGVDRYNTLTTQNPNYLTYLDIKSVKGFQIIEVPSEKTIQYEVLEAIPFKKSCDKLIDPSCVSESLTGKTSAADFVQQFEDGTLNYLVYQVASDKNKPTYYSLGQTGKILKIISANELKALVNAE